MDNEHITLVRRLFADLSRKDNYSRHDEWFTSDVLVHGPATGEITRGSASDKRPGGELSKTFEHIEFEINEIVARNQKVIVRWTARLAKGFDGTCDTETTASGTSIYRFRGDKICEVWQSWDRLGVLEQIAELEVKPIGLKAKADRDQIRSAELEKYSVQASRLSKRERECLSALLDRKTAKQAAEHLSLSPRTVESYYENIKDKLGCDSKKELLATAQILDRLNLL